MELFALQRDTASADRDSAAHLGNGRGRTQGKKPLRSDRKVKERSRPPSLKTAGASGAGNQGRLQKPGQQNLSAPLSCLSAPRKWQDTLRSQGRRDIQTWTRRTCRQDSCERLHLPPDADCHGLVNPPWWIWCRGRELAYSLLWHLLGACLPVSDGLDARTPVCTRLIIPLWDVG